MSERNTHVAVIKTFLRLRITGIALGIGELLAAIRVLNDRFVDPNNTAEVRRSLGMLWCKNETEQWHLDRIWQTLQDEQTEFDILTQGPLAPPPQPPVSIPDTHLLPKSGDSESENKSVVNAPELSFFPFKPPSGRTAESPTVELQTYWPVSRRYMSYTWRYLRQPTYEGCSDVLDIASTVSKVALSGCFVEPIYQRRLVNHARLLFLLDHRGSMMPFHRYLRDMVETLNQSEIASENRAVYYFENVPGSSLFQTPYLTKPIERTQILRFIDPNTGVLIVSDAGAARGHPRNRKRVRSTFEFLLTLYTYTRFVAWLNPMPPDRWVSTSAAAIASTVPMFPMNEYGFSAAIDILSGRRMSSLTMAS